MDIEKRFAAIQNFLNKHIKLVNNEVLELNQDELTSYFDWMNELKKLNTTELISLESDYDTTKIKASSFVDFIKTVFNLIAIPKQEDSTNKIPKSLNRKLSLKKQHELKQIRDLIKEDHYFVDIGSGAGHLSSYLVSGNESTSLCLDVEKNYQDIGKEKLAKYAPEILKKIEFKTVLVDKNTKLKIPSKSYLLGLHTCGDLSPHLINIYLSKKEFDSFLNFGCCYHKLSSNHFNLSKTASFPLNKFSLTLAAKSYKTLLKDDFLKRKAVKDYRYVLHYLMQEKFQDDFTTVGNGHKNDYNGEFCDYVYKYYPKARMLSKEELNTFFELNKKQAWEVQLFGIIRSLLSRVVELYIILDRALYLQENQVKVEIIESFNKDLSPRNIAIRANKTS